MMPTWLQYLLAVATTLSTIAIAFIAVRQWRDRRYYLRAWIATEWKAEESRYGPYVRLALQNLGQTTATDFRVTFWLEQPNYLPSPLTAAPPARLVPKAKHEIPLRLADEDRSDARQADSSDSPACLTEQREVSDRHVAGRQPLAILPVEDGHAGNA